MSKKHKHRRPNNPVSVSDPNAVSPRPRQSPPQRLAADNLKCQTKGVDRRDEAASFTDDEMKRLKAIFPDGVCDWTKKGVGHTGVVPWASFGPAPENLVFDVRAQQQLSSSR